MTNAATAEPTVVSRPLPNRLTHLILAGNNAQRAFAAALLVPTAGSDARMRTALAEYLNSPEFSADGLASAVRKAYGKLANGSVRLTTMGTQVLRYDSQTGVSVELTIDADDRISLVMFGFNSELVHYTGEFTWRNKITGFVGSGHDAIVSYYDHSGSSREAV